MITLTYQRTMLVDVYVGFQSSEGHSSALQLKSTLLLKKMENLNHKTIRLRNVDRSQQGKCNLPGKFHSFWNNLWTGDSEKYIWLTFKHIHQCMPTNRISHPEIASTLGFQINTWNLGKYTLSMSTTEYFPLITFFQKIGTSTINFISQFHSALFICLQLKVFCLVFLWDCLMEFGMFFSF